MTRRIVSFWHWIVAVSLFSVMLGILQFFPASYWFEVRSVNVRNSHAGDEIEMAVDRTINHDFHAVWSVTIRKWEGNGWVVRCNASGASNYKTNAVFPVPLTLKWWTWDQCKSLGQGRYQLETVWNIDGLGLMPNKQVPSVSNVFDVE